MPLGKYLPSRVAAGFTLLEVCIAMIIVLVVVGIAIPSLNGVFSDNQIKSSFQAFDELAQDAHGRAIAEGRPYVLIWGPKEILLRPDEPANKAEAEGLRKVDIPKGEVWNVFFPASLFKKSGKVTAAIWTFWPGGVCEPATVAYQGKTGKWSAVYNPFTVQAETTYE